MLITVKTLGALNFSQLMQVYETSNRENGNAFYPQLSPDEQLLEAEQDFYAFLRNFFKTEGGVYYILTENDRYLCALRTQPYRDGLLIAGLETAPGHRGKGCAGRLLNGVIDRLQMQPPVRLYAHIAHGNYPSVRVHEKAGFSKLSDQSILIDGSASRRYGTFCRIIKEPGSD